MNRPTSFTPTIDLLLSGAKLHARVRAGPVKKTPLLHPEDLATVISTVFLVDNTIGLANPIEIWSLFRSLIEYHTLCNFSCFNKLKVKHFELVDNNIMIIFPRAKNDQLHRGQHSSLAATPHSALCPVYIMKVYFGCFVWILAQQQKTSLLWTFNSGASLVTPFLSSTRPSAPLLQRKMCRPFLQNMTLTTRASPTRPRRWPVSLRHSTQVRQRWRLCTAAAAGLRIFLCDINWTLTNLRDPSLLKSLLWTGLAPSKDILASCDGQKIWYCLSGRQQTCSMFYRVRAIN